MVSYDDRPQNLGTGAYINMAAEDRDTRLANTDRHLLKQHAVDADHAIGMHNDSVRVRKDQTSTNTAVQRQIRSSDYAPEAVPHDGPAPQNSMHRARALRMALIRTNGSNQRLRRRPFEPSLFLPCPVRH